jgi:hypothetical protein
MMMISRNYRILDGDELVDEGEYDIDWEVFRKERNRLLDESDWRVVPDRPDAQDWVDYRSFLRDLPENFDGDYANAAMDAFESYDKPEEA